MSSSNTTSADTKKKSRITVENRQARHQYFIEETVEAGLVLQGWEVKAILAGQANFNGGAAFVRLSGGEAFLDSLTVTPLASTDVGALVTRDPNRSRKLLLKRAELDKLSRRVAERGYTLVPLSLKGGYHLKLLVGVARGKRLADKRDTVKARDNARELQRDLKAMR